MVLFGTADQFFMGLRIIQFAIEIALVETSGMVLNGF